MSNALSTLFGDIADAIREKSGETGTMKPAEFPDKIAAIQVGGGSLSSNAVSFASGKFTASSNSMTINHNLGAVPDVVLIVYATIASGTHLQSSMMYSQRWMDASGRYRGFLVVNGVEFYNSTRPVTGVGMGGHPSLANENSFQVGADSGYGTLGQDAPYYWIAIAGTPPTQ